MAAERRWCDVRPIRPGVVGFTHTGPMVLDDELVAAGRRVGAALAAAGESVAVAEGSCGGLVSAALLAAPGASAWYRGGAVIYTPAAVRGFLASALRPPEGMVGASEPFVRYLAEASATALRATWGVGEGGATGPSANPYGDPPGHCWVAVHGPVLATRHLLTGRSDRLENMGLFALHALSVLEDAITSR